MQANADPGHALSLNIALWRVFQILLEHACKADYQLLITKVLDRQEVEKEKLREEMNDAVHSELIEKAQLKQITLNLQTYSQELEKEKNNERGLRMKLEEEYMQLQRNHEEEVQLRL